VTYLQSFEHATFGPLQTNGALSTDLCVSVHADMQTDQTHGFSYEITRKGKEGKEKRKKKLNL